jgi:hypothetical protein
MFIIISFSELFLLLPNILILLSVDIMSGIVLNKSNNSVKKYGIIKRK